MKISGPSFSHLVAFPTILVAIAVMVAFKSPIQSFPTLSVPSPTRDALRGASCVSRLARVIFSITSQIRARVAVQVRWWCKGL